eukprot:scaffold136593_cov19-Tisochrysis_lutea.AAC.1
MSASWVARPESPLVTVCKQARPAAIASHKIREGEEEQACQDKGAVMQWRSNCCTAGTSPGL